ncbi:hypothetical protein QP500_08435 [Pauljensenia sp. UMB0018B]|nr:hypothetical protein [Schaalia odontolytica]MDK7340472.1 hypothetical protein [Pauljensenia sp. UMB0018B]
MSTDEDTRQHGAWFSMPFPINVDNLFTFKDQCEQASGALHTADGDTVRASSIVGQQEALLVDPCQHDLQITSDVCEEISNDLKALTNAVSELAWSMKSVREEYKGIAQKAQDCGLIVEGDTVTLFDESDDDLVHSFNELQAQAEVQRLNYERAEHVFSLALDSLKVDAYEQWIEPVFSGLKSQFVLDNEHPYANLLPYTMGATDLLGQTASAATIQFNKGLYQPPAEFFAAGDLSNWKFIPTGTQVTEPVGTRTIAPVLGKAGKVAGVAGGGRRRRHYRLRHVPNRYPAAPRMERGPQGSTSGRERHCDRGSYLGRRLARSQRRCRHRRYCLGSFRPRWRCRWRYCRRRHRRGGRPLLWRNDR